jgi:hypothetical protein
MAANTADSTPAEFAVTFWLSPRGTPNPAGDFANGALATKCRSKMARFRLRGKNRSFGPNG